MIKLTDNAVTAAHWTGRSDRVRPGDVVTWQPREGHELVAGINRWYPDGSGQSPDCDTVKLVSWDDKWVYIEDDGSFLSQLSNDDFETIDHFEEAIYIREARFMWPTMEFTVLARIPVQKVDIIMTAEEAYQLHEAQDCMYY